MEYGWTCNRPGGTYTYVVTAKTRVGATLTRMGSFRPVSDEDVPVAVELW
jgi:hypothetical protein